MGKSAVHPSIPVPINISSHMKRNLAYLLLAGLFWNCAPVAQKEEPESVKVEPVTVRVSTDLPYSASMASAALIQRSGVEGDVRTILSSSAEKGEGGNAAFTFADVSTHPEAQSWYYGGVYPASAINSAGNTVYITVPVEQTAGEDASVYVAWSREKFSERPVSLHLGFSPLTVSGTLKFSGLKLGEDETLLAVSISAPGHQLAGSAALNTFSGEVNYASAVEMSAIRIVTRDLEIVDGCAQVAFVTKPYSLDDGEQYTISFETSSRTFELQSASLDVDLAATPTIPGDDEEEDDGEWTPDPGYTVTGRTWYISPDGDDNAGGTSVSDAVKTFDKVVTLIGPGDQVRILPGTYESPSWNDIITLEKKHSGTPGNYISFVAHDPEDRPVLHAGGKGVWNAINCDASYIAFDGLEVCGDNATIKLQDAYDAALNYYNTGKADWGAVAQYNTNGISVGGTSSSAKPNHVIVRNCLVHDMPGAGLSAIRADYITFEYNRIYNCAWFMMYGGSGISFLTPSSVDSYTGYKMIVRGNIVSNCHTDVPWVRVGSAFDYSDGNGIIIDINDGYNGRTLVENNVSFNNGGSGIHGYRANHVDIVGNTAYWNGWKYSGNYGEIWAHQGSDVRIYNNISYGRPTSQNGRCNLGNNAVYTNNVYYQGQVKISGTADLVADPLFVNLSRDNFEADFHLTEGSPAIGHGTTDMPYLPERDIEGKSRKGRFDCGAYQYND